MIFSEIFGYYSYKLNNINDSFLMIYNSKEPDPKFNRRSKEKDDKCAFDLALLDQYPIIFTQSMQSAHYCTIGECNSTKLGFCDHLSESNPNPGCAKSTYIDDDPACADEDSGENPGPNDPVEELDYTFVQNARKAMHDIRDFILSTTNKGRQYTDYYYKISYVWRVTGTSTSDENKQELRNLMHFIRQKSILFLDSDNNKKIIDTDEANYLRGLILKYKNVHNNAEYQSIFDNLSKDLGKLENKNKGAYLDYILD